jgi:regulator of sigma E protease
LANAISENLIFAWNILKAILGLGFVIFIHELGHFLLAKWNGVKVERFSIGFGPTLASFRRGVGIRVGSGSRPPGPDDPPTWGETEYILAALPLGGYVKMLGESIEESTEEAVKSPDPRAYHNKSVWARMQIITAGVIMNVLLGIACFAFVYSQGVTDQPAKVGSVLAGGPAYKAGIRPGDEIVAIDGRRDVGFKDLMSKVNYSGAGQLIKFTIKRPGTAAEQTLEIEPLRGETIPVPTIGIQGASSLDLLPRSPFQALPGEKVDKSRPNPGFEGEDRVIAVGPEGGPLEPVSDYDSFIHKAERLKDRPIVVEVERKKAAATKDGVEEKTTHKVTVPPHHFVDFGFRLTPGPIAAVRNDSPAQRAGLREGDRIVAVDGRKDYDPMRLPDEARASAGRPMTLSIERPTEGKPPRTIEATVTPDDSPAWVDPVDPIGRKVPLDVPGLGLALAIEPRLQAVAEGSPADRAGLKPGNILRSVIIARARDEDEKSEPKPITIKLDDKTSGWPLAFVAIQQIPWKSIQFTVDSSDRPITVNPEVDPERPYPLRGLAFQGLLRKLPPMGLADSLRRGWDETIEIIVNIFGMFKGISQGRVGRDAFSGILGIGKVAYTSASMGWTSFIQFLGLLSVNLAVLNFLPIPPLDGGQFTFLAAEKIRGKPLPEAALNLLTIAGVVFVVGLILLINGNDIFRLIQSNF